MITMFSTFVKYLWGKNLAMETENSPAEWKWHQNMAKIGEKQTNAIFLKPPNGQSLKFGILNSFIHISTTAKADLIANFIELGNTETCSVSYPFGRCISISPPNQNNLSTLRLGFNKTVIQLTNITSDKVRVFFMDKVTLKKWGCVSHSKELLSFIPSIVSGDENASPFIWVVKRIVLCFDLFDANIWDISISSQVQSQFCTSHWIAENEKVFKKWSWNKNEAEKKIFLLIAVSSSSSCSSCCESPEESGKWIVNQKSVGLKIPTLEGRNHFSWKRKCKRFLIASLSSKLIQHKSHI